MKEKLTTTDLSEQLCNPQHVHIRYPNGKLFLHRTPKEDEKDHVLPELWGKPIRFTRLAAERVVESLGLKGQVEFVPAPHKHSIEELKNSILKGEWKLN